MVPQDWCSYAGTWLLSYTNGVSTTYTVNAAGYVTARSHDGKGLGQLAASEDSQCPGRPPCARLEGVHAPGKYELLTVENDQLQMKHFFSSDKLCCTATGALISKGACATELGRDRVAAEGRTCEQEGLADIATPASCRVACESSGLATGYREGSWPHSPKCFAVISGRWAGNCHWNHSPAAREHIATTRALCRKASTQSSEVASRCWRDCKETGYYCPAFCCQPEDGVGNPSCWGVFTYDECCPGRAPEEPSSTHIVIGEAVLELYRGPSDHNQPKFTERTLEVALGMHFMRHQLENVMEHNAAAPIEIGNVLPSYWPKEWLVYEQYLPWQVVDLIDNGLDATKMSFKGKAVLSISTVEHFGYDNEGVLHAIGFRMEDSQAGREEWVAKWDAAPAFLARLVAEARSFLVTFPIGFNPRLDAVVAQNEVLRPLARVARRVDAGNAWEIDPSSSFDYHYDFRDTYTNENVLAMTHPDLPRAYRTVYGGDITPRLQPPRHPRFRFANAICIVSNMPELLA